MINVGIIGCGFVGGALKDWLENNNPECKLFISDPPKGYHDDFPISLQIFYSTENQRGFKKRGDSPTTFPQQFQLL